ncbi:unnamed protein product, partial [Musa acuminata subsp. malaccensis]
LYYNFLLDSKIRTRNSSTPLVTTRAREMKPTPTKKKGRAHLSPERDGAIGSHDRPPDHERLVDLHQHLLVVLLERRPGETRHLDPAVAVATVGDTVGKAEHHPHVGVADPGEDPPGRGRAEEAEARRDLDPPEPAPPPTSPAELRLAKAPTALPAVGVVVPPPLPVPLQAALVRLH